MSALRLTITYATLPRTPPQVTVTPTMWERDPTASEVSDWILTVYQTLAPHLIEQDDQMSVDEATTFVVDATSDELDLPREDAEFAIQRLLDRGYLYAVDGDLFVTEADDDSSVDTEEAN